MERPSDAWLPPSLRDRPERRTPQAATAAPRKAGAPERRRADCLDCSLIWAVLASIAIFKRGRTRTRATEGVEVTSSEIQTEPSLPDPVRHHLRASRGRPFLFRVPLFAARLSVEQLGCAAAATGENTTDEDHIHRGAAARHSNAAMTGAGRVRSHRPTRTLGCLRIADVFGVTGTLDCVFLINRRGRFARSICVDRTSGSNLRSVNRSELSIRRNCLVSGETNNVCQLGGTMTRDKEMISGVADYDTGAVLLFNMVRS